MNNNSSWKDYPSLRIESVDLLYEKRKELEERMRELTYKKTNKIDKNSELFTNEMLPAIDGSNSFDKGINIDTAINIVKNALAKFNFLTRLIYRKKYKELLAKENKLDLVIRKNKEIDEQIEKIESELAEVDNKIEKLPNELKYREEIKRELTYDEDGTLVIDATKPINSICKIVDKDFDPNSFGIESLALVHASSNFPQNGIIRAAQEKKLKATSYDIQTYQHRLTTHFALNGRVGKNNGGDWDEMPVIIIDPLKNHINNIDCIVSVDSWFIGNFKLSDEAVILVEEKYYDTLSDEIKKQKNVIKYKGFSEIAVQKVLLLMGYLPQTVNTWAWQNQENDIILKNYIKEKYPNLITAHHSYTAIHSQETDLQRRDILIADYRNESFVDSIHDSKLSISEISFLYQHYFERSRRDSFMEYTEEELLDFFYKFCRDYGIGIKDGEAYILDDYEAYKRRSNFYNEDLTPYTKFYELISKSPNTGNKKRS